MSKEMIWKMWPALIVLNLVGCTASPQFKQQFNLTKVASKDSEKPLVGAYEGVWHSRTPRYEFFPPIQGSTARLVISPAPDSSGLEIWLALSDFRGIGATGFFNPANLKMDQNHGSVAQFTAKIGAGESLVLVVDGRVNGDDLVLRYKIVDVGDEEVQHGQGTITLHRAKP